MRGTCIFEVIRMKRVSKAGRKVNEEFTLLVLCLSFQFAGVVAVQMEHVALLYVDNGAAREVSC